MTMIINSVAYQKGARLGDITIDDISEVIQQPETFVWLALHEPDDALLLKIQQEFGLHELSIEDGVCTPYGFSAERFAEVIETEAVWDVRTATRGGRTLQSADSQNVASRE